MKRLLLAVMLLMAAHASEAQAVRTNIFNKLMTVGSVDSTAVLDMRYANYAALCVKLMPGTGVVPFAKVGLTIRIHTSPNADSINTFVWNPRMGTAYAGIADSIVFGTYGSSIVGLPQAEEIPVFVSLSRSAPRTTFIQLTGGSSFGGFPRGQLWMSIVVRYLSGSGTARVQIAMVTGGE